MIVVLHPVGNQNVRALILALQKNKLLDSFHTSIAWRSTVFDRWFPQKIIKQLKRRQYPGIPNKKIYTYPTTDIARLLLTRLQAKFSFQCDYFSPERTYDYVDKRTALYIEKRAKEINVVYGYDDKCLASFRTAKSTPDIRLVYEAAFAYAPYINNVFYEEKELEPEWSDNLNYFTSERLDKQEEELDLADQVIVASTYAKKTLASKNIDKKVITVPYGAPMAIPEVELNNKKYNSEKLKVLFVGALTQRKGLSYLFKAVERTDANVELYVIGSPISPTLSATLKSKLSRHSWSPTMPHAQILAQMYACDVLILPSIAEAFGLVLLEALSRGLPIIATENTGAPDIITHGKEGFIVPIRDAGAISNHLSFLDGNRMELERMSKEAWLRARELSWDRYQRSIIKVINSQMER